MAFFSAFWNCFMPSLSSQRVSDDAGGSSGVKASKESKCKSKSSSETPLVVSYFPSNSYLSRL
ncbi:hypothetical protein PRUPE_2G006300 [Prunus persica]|uniref:Uncharacterized protein n=1 Tax=Prunus persica TaxID=3760 RepID=A0A251Q8W9_PRUPE|nr:hypothetical protein PRUPE_2G006300 [Prunus persica]